MRIRALISVLLMAVWLLPAAGSACSTDAHGGVEHAHAHGEISSASAPSENGHDHASHGSAAHGHGSAGAHPSSDSAPAQDESSCCPQSSQSPAAKLAVLEPNPRATDALVAVLPEALDLGIALEHSITEAAFKRRQPPPLPFAQTRRPLLI